MNSGGLAGSAEPPAPSPSWEVPTRSYVSPLGRFEFLYPADFEIVLDQILERGSLVAFQGPVRLFEDREERALLSVRNIPTNVATIDDVIAVDIAPGPWTKTTLNGQEAAIKDRSTDISINRQLWVIYRGQQFVLASGYLSRGNAEAVEDQELLWRLVTETFRFYDFDESQG